MREKTNVTIINNSSESNIIEIFPFLAPVLTIRYSSIVSETFSSVYPAENSITVPISTRDITLSINIDGKWNLPDNSNSFNSELTIAIVSTANAELYKFYINNWDGEELIAMQLRIHLTNPGIFYES